MNVAGAHGGAVVRGIAPLFGRLDDSVAARDKGYVPFAIGRARSRHPAVHAIVAGLAELPVDLLVAAIGRRRTAVRTHVLAVGASAIRGAQVAQLRRILNFAIAAISGERTVGIARAVRSVVLAVIALLVAVLDAVAATTRQRAIRVALAVPAYVLRCTVLALLARLDHAIAPLERAVAVALSTARPLSP